MMTLKWKVDDGRSGTTVTEFGDCFWWEEGNGGCDCNRAKEFLKEEWPCGQRIEVEVSCDPKCEACLEYPEP